MAKKKKTKLGGKIARVVVFVCLLSYFCIVFFSQQATMAQLNKKSENLKTEIASQEKLSKHINEQMKKENELERVEKIAREKLGYLKKNERLFVDSSAK